MAKTITLNYVKVMHVSLDFVPATATVPASWTLHCDYTVGYQDKTGTRIDHPSSVTGGKTSLGVRMTDTPGDIMPNLLNAIATVEGMSFANGDQAIDQHGNLLS